MDCCCVVGAINDTPIITNVGQGFIIVRTGCECITYIPLYDAYINYAITAFVAVVLTIVLLWISNIIH